MRGRATRVALPALIVLVLVAVVAVASTGSAPSGSNASRRAVRDAPRHALHALDRRRDRRRSPARLRAHAAEGDREADGVRPLSTVASSPGCFLVFAAVARRTVGSQDWNPVGRTAARRGERLRGAVPTSPEPRTDPVRRTSRASRWIADRSSSSASSSSPTAAYVALRRGGAAVRATRGRSSRRSSPSLLDDALDDLRAEADPRRAIIAAYARLERVLAAQRRRATRGGDPRRVPRARPRRPRARRRTRSAA